jgi:hypothetical protein
MTNDKAQMSKSSKSKGQNGVVLAFKHLDLFRGQDLEFNCVDGHAPTSRSSQMTDRKAKKRPN